MNNSNNKKKAISIQKGERVITAIESESLPLYFKDLSSKKKYRVLSLEEEQELGREIQKGNKRALDALVCHNLKFVISVAKIYQNKGLPLDDLVEAGNIGLINAAKLYDPERKNRFTSFAVWYIKQSILLTLTLDSRTVKIPINKYNNQFKLQKLIENYIKEHKGEASLTKEKIAKELNLEIKQVTDLLDTPTGRAVSLNSQTSKEDEKLTLIDVIEDKTAKRPDLELDVQSFKQELDKVLNLILEPEEIKLIKMFYGIGYEKAYSMAEIASLTIDPQTGKPVTKESIRQRKEKILRKLRLSENTHLKNIKKYI